MNVFLIKAHVNAAKSGRQDALPSLGSGEHIQIG